MTSRTEKIFKVVKSSLDIPKQSLSKAKKASNRSIEEMTSVAIYLCSVVECYKIDETIRWEHSTTSSDFCMLDLTRNAIDLKLMPVQSKLYHQQRAKRSANATLSPSIIFAAPSHPIKDQSLA